MKKIFTLSFVLLFVIAVNAQNTQVQFINNSADSIMQSVKVLMNGDLKKDSLSFRKATPFITTAGDSTYTILIQSKINTTKTVAVTRTLQAGKKYVFVLNGVTNDTSYQKNEDSISILLNIVVIDQSTLTAPSSDQTTMAFVNGSTDAPTFNLYSNDDTSLLLAANDSLNQFIGVTVGDSLVKLRLRTTDGAFNISTFLFSLSTVGGQKTTALTSGFIAPGSNMNRSNFSVYVVDSLGNIISSQNVSLVNNKNNLVEKISVYPNPANDFIQVDYTLAKQADLNYNIYNLNGEMVQNNSIGFAAKGLNERVIQLQHLPSGVYFLQMQSELSSKTVSFIVK